MVVDQMAIDERLIPKMSDLSKFAVLSIAIVSAGIAFAGTTVSVSAEDFRCDRTGINADKYRADIDRTGNHIFGLCERDRVVVQFNVIRKAPLVLPKVWSSIDHRPRSLC